MSVLENMLCGRSHNFPPLGCLSKGVWSRRRVLGGLRQKGVHSPVSAPKRGTPRKRMGNLQET